MHNESFSSESPRVASEEDNDECENNQSVLSKHKKTCSVPNFVPDQPLKTHPAPRPGKFRYGWGLLRCECLQFFNRPIWFLIWLTAFAVVQGLIVTGIWSTTITSIERQFGYTSSTVAMFGTMYDVGYGLCSILVGYCGYHHKPRWIGSGALLMVVGCMLCTVNNFIIGPYLGSDRELADVCVPNNGTYSTPACGSNIVPTQWYYMFNFALGNLLIGVGATPLYVLGSAHIDDITYRGYGNMYLGVMYAGSALGPAIGFLLGKPILAIWVDIIQPKGVSVDIESHEWVGAWWIGYLVGAGLLLLPIIPLLGFPSEFPGTEHVRESKRSLDDNIEENKELKHDLKSILPATKELLTNAPFVAIAFAASAEAIVIGGNAAFLPKFIETQFHMTSSDASLYTGYIIIPGVVGGVMTGAFLSKHFAWSCRQLIMFGWIMALISTVFSVCTLIGCEGQSIVGIDEPYYRATLNKSVIPVVQLDDICRGTCACSKTLYSPLCSSDMQTYFSPCHAGCQKKNKKELKNFADCACFPPGISDATSGRCSPGCKWFPLFAVLAFLMMFFTFMNNVPLLSAIFLVLPEKQGSYGIGVQQVFLRFLGFIPSPILFGKIIDYCCKLWNTDKCSNETSSCLEYDVKIFRYYMFAAGFIGKFLTFIFIFIAYKTYRLPPKISEESAEVGAEAADMERDSVMREVEETTRTIAVEINAPPDKRRISEISDISTPLEVKSKYRLSDAGDIAVNVELRRASNDSEKAVDKFDAISSGSIRALDRQQSNVSQEKNVSIAIFSDNKVSPGLVVTYDTVGSRNYALEE